MTLPQPTSSPQSLTPPTPSVENLWWLAIVLWVRRDSNGDVREVGCVYPRTAGEVPNVAAESTLLRPALEWNVRAAEWRPVLATYKRHAFQEELDSQAKKKGIASAEVHEDAQVAEELSLKRCESRGNGSRRKGGGLEHSAKWRREEGLKERSRA